MLTKHHSAHFCSLVYFLERINNFALPCLICLQTISLSNYAGFMNISNMTRVHILSLMLFTYLEGLSQTCQVHRCCSSISMCHLIFVSNKVVISLLGQKIIRLDIFPFTILSVEWKYLILSISLISIYTLIFLLI